MWLAFFDVFKIHSFVCLCVCMPSSQSWRPRPSRSMAVRVPWGLAPLRSEASPWTPLHTSLFMTSIPTSQLQTSNRVCWAFFPSLELSYASPASQVFLFLLHGRGFLDSVNTFCERMGYRVT